jgi:acetate kinase
MRVLTLNAGSNSLKFEIVTVPDQNEAGDIRWGTSVVAGSYDDVGKSSSVFNLLANKKVIHAEQTQIRDHEHAAALLFEWIERGAGRSHGISALTDIDRVAHRVVHGADCFTQAEPISAELVDQIAALDELAPLHNEPARKIIKAAQGRFASTVPMFAIFDTAFHRSIPDEAALYPLPLELARRHRIRRYGFHGISHHYLALRFAQLANRPLDELKLITLHLEGGSSAAAIRSGKSIDTSMGFTPLEGLMMGTRCGDIDPAIVTHLMRKENWTADEMDRFLNKECGLLGVSGLSSDTRELREHLSDHKVDLALRIFCYRVRKYIGAYMAALGGADAIIFGGGIGENTVIVRQRICAGLEWCGAIIDERRNVGVIDQEGRISAPSAATHIWVIPTQEGLMMAHYASARP